MATRKQWLNDIQQQLNTDLTEKGFIEYRSEDEEHFYAPLNCDVYLKTAINDKSIKISLAHTEEDLLYNPYFFLSLQVDHDQISFVKRFNDHTHSINLGKYIRATQEQYITAVKYISTEIVSAIMNAIHTTPEMYRGI